MELREVAHEIGAPLRDGEHVVVTGAGTHDAVGNPTLATCTRLRVPSGIVTYEPADLTVRVWAGTPVRELQATLAEAGQEVPLDPRDPTATVGGVIACGLSGVRRLRHGPVRDAVLQVDAIDGQATLFKAGGPTVKNVTGYDVPRLLVGSFGTLAVMLQLILRCRPLPAASAWYRVSSPDLPGNLRTAMLRPAAILWDGRDAWVLAEGNEQDLAAEAEAAELGEPVDAAPPLPDAAHRGRISVDPAQLGALAIRLRAISGLRWLAEVGVGTVHVAADDATTLLAARTGAHECGAWMLREAGGDGCDGFGTALPHLDLARRVKAAFDPRGLLAPGRVPL